MIIVEKYLHSFSTYAIILTCNPYIVSISLTCKAMVVQNVFKVLNKLMVTWLGSHLWFKKRTMGTKVSTPFDIHKSKFNMKMLQDSRA